MRQLLKRLPPFMEHMQRLEMHTCIHAALSHTPAHGSSHEERGCSETLPHLVTMHVITRHACSRAFPSCDTAAGDVVLRNNTVHNAYYQKDEGPAICAFATGLDDHPSGTPLQPQCPPPRCMLPLMGKALTQAGSSFCPLSAWVHLQSACMNDVNLEERLISEHAAVSSGSSRPSGTQC